MENQTISCRARKIRQTLLVLGFAAAATLAIQNSATSVANAGAYAIPSAPTNITFHPGAAGMVVHWDEVTANPAVTNYIVSGGAGSCPVVVSANSHRVVTVPIVSGQKSFVPTVQAVNSLGISASGVALKKVSAADFAQLSVNPNYKAAQILEFSDFHGAIEATSSNIGAAGLTASFNADRAKNAATFTVSAGDNIGAAPPISAFFDELSTIDSLNAMGLDASTYGNHEHDKDLSALQKVMAASKFKWVVSNYSTLKPLVGGTNQATSFTVIDRGGVKVGVVGANTPETPEVTKPGNLTFSDGGANVTIKISDGIKEINKAIVDAKAAGADIVVAILHDGFTQNDGDQPSGPLIYLANNIKGAAVVFGGHTHLQYSNLEKGSTYKSAAPIIGQVVNAGTTYNRVQVCFNASTKVVLGSTVQLVAKTEAAALTPDASVAAIVAGYKAQLSSKVDGKIGQVSATFPNNIWNGSTFKIQRSGETALGDYIADAMKKAYKTDFAITNGGGIRDSLPASGYAAGDPKYVRPKIYTSVDSSISGPYDITYGDALAVLPFGNYAVTTTLTGSDIWKALNNGTSGYPTEGRFPQISGLKFTFDPTKTFGSQVTTVTKSDGTSIKADDSKYTIVTNDYMLYGGDGYTMFNPKLGTIRDLLVDVLANALKADAATGKPTLLPSLDGRITKLG